MSLKTSPAGFEALGINENDYINNEQTDFGRTILVEVFTGTIDHMGNEMTEVITGTKFIKAVLHERTKTYERTDEGLVQHAPGYLMSRVSDDVGTGNRVSILNDSQKWRVFNIVSRDGIHNYSELFHWEGQEK